VLFLKFVTDLTEKKSCKTVYYDTVTINCFFFKTLIGMVSKVESYINMSIHNAANHTVL